MSKVIAIDYGSKKVGVAISDISQKIAFSLDTVSNENLISFLEQLFKNEKMGTTIWSPLASGLLTGKYIKGMPVNTRTSLKNYKLIKDSFESEAYKVRHQKVEEVYKLAQKLDIPLPNLALGWCLKNDNVSTVILGASKTEQLSQNLNTLNYMDTINEEVMGKVEKILQD